MEVTKPLMIELSPQELGLVIAALGEVRASVSRSLLNRLETCIIANEKPVVPENTFPKLRAVDER